MLYQDFYPEEESVEEKRWSWVGEINHAFLVIQINTNVKKNGETDRNVIFGFCKDALNS